MHGFFTWKYTCFDSQNPVFHLAVFKAFCQFWPKMHPFGTTNGTILALQVAQKGCISVFSKAGAGGCTRVCPGRRPMPKPNLLFWHPVGSGSVVPSRGM